MKKIDLSIDYCGVKFKNPFCLSSSPVAASYDMVSRAFDTGWGGVFYKTLGLALKVVHPSPRLNAYHVEEKRVAGLQNVEQISDRPLSDELKDITAIKKRYPSHAVVVSIMGFTKDDWAELAERVEGAGADMLELNFSCPQMAQEGTGTAVGKDEALIELFTRSCKRVVNIPVVAKMTPNVTDMVPLAMAAKRGGADGVSAINTIRSITGIDVDKFVTLPNVDGKSIISGYSGASVKPIALRFVAEMAQDLNLKIPISGIGGIYTWLDAVQFLLVGARTIQVTTGIMQYGYRIVEDMIEGMTDYLADRGFSSPEEIVGLALRNLVTPSDLNHGVEAKSQIDLDKCVNCGQCYITCMDGGHQAIEFKSDRKPVVDEEKCVGCLMCSFICPVWDCITYKMVERAV
ncbi:MAG: NAD-dependent dihydropyrimidine dehydrogenase subunit PreA [Candidatus Eisenbacteria bacterium]|nr:NAD-dependent dihydropyrimidine dehydrogenase subunit PreA [Candidatus Eisenbacteria bacterium]